MPGLPECVFSQGGDIVTKRRTRLTGDPIRMIVCLKAWGIFTGENMDNDTDMRAFELQDNFDFFLYI